MWAAVVMLLVVVEEQMSHHRHSTVVACNYAAVAVMDDFVKDYKRVAVVVVD